MIALNMAELIVMGVDPGTQVTGYGVVVMKDGRLQTLDFGCIRPPRAERISKRRLAIYEGLGILLDRFKPDAVAVETQYVRDNVRAAMMIGMVRGITILAATLRQIATYEYSPSRAKKAVSGQGRASKQQVQIMVQRLLGLKELPEPEDAADALALAICHAHSAQNPLSLGEEI